MARMTAFLALLLLTATLAPSADRVEDLAQGRFLVASKDLPDPNFAETVILLVKHDDTGSMGLMVNRRSNVPLSRVFRELEWAKGRTDPVYMGGPVERMGVRALLRTFAKPEDGERVIRGVYMLTTTKPLERTLTDGVKPADLRVYLGYAGWGAGQLENEVEIGAWHILRADPGSIFDADPDSLWDRLAREAERRIARSIGPRLLFENGFNQPGATLGQGLSESRGEFIHRSSTPGRHAAPLR